MTTNIHYLIAGMAVLLVVIWQYSRQRQMDDRNSRMFRRLLSVVRLDVAAELDFQHFWDWMISERMHWQRHFMSIISTANIHMQNYH